MSRMKKHDRSVICFDMNMKSSNAERARKAFDYLLHMKQFVPKNQNDLMKLLIFNTDHKNGIYVPFSEFISYKNFVSDAMKGNKPTASKWISAITTASQWLTKSHEEKGLYTLQLIIFTDLSTPLEKADSDDVEVLTEILISYNIYLYILGPDVIEPHYITSVEDIRNWSRRIQFKSESECECAFTTNIISKLVRDTNGIMCEPFLGIELINIYRSTRGKMEWKAPLELGHTNIQLNVTTARCMDLFSTPRISSVVTPGTRFTVKGSEIPSDEVINAFRMDEKIIVVPKDVRDNYIKDYNGPRMLKLVAFVSRESIPEAYIFGGEAHNVEIPAESSDAHALRTLILTCHRMNRCGLAWRAYNRNNCPRLYVLFPRREPTCHFYMVPFAKKDDIQKPYRGKVTNIQKLPKGKTDTEYYQNVTKYLEMLSIKESKPALHPILTSGPWLSCYLQRLNHLKKREDGEISVDEPLPQLDFGRSKLDDNAVALKEFLKNYLKQKEKDEIPNMQVNDDDGNDDEW